MTTPDRTRHWPLTAAWATPLGIGTRVRTSPVFYRSVFSPSLGSLRRSDRGRVTGFHGVTVDSPGGPAHVPTPLSVGSRAAVAAIPAISPREPIRTPERRARRRCRTAARRGRCGVRTPPRPRRCGRCRPARPIAPGSILARAEAVGWSPRHLGDAAPRVRRGGGRSDWVGWAPTQEVDITGPKSVALSPHWWMW